MTAKGTYFPLRINNHVPLMQYAADVRAADGLGTIVIPAPAAADADAIVAALAGTVGKTSYSYVIDAKFGRNIGVTASAATGANSTVIIRGEDYLGQPMSETLTITNATGTTQVVGKKAFKLVESLEVGVATTGATFAVGTGNVLGLPYKSQKLVVELVNKEAPTAGTFVDALATGTTQSATSDDTRGTYTPHSSVVPNGSREYELTIMHDRSNLHGDAQFYAA